MRKGPNTIGLLPGSELGGVKIRRHVLEREAIKLANILKRLGARLRDQLVALPEPILPDEEWLKYFKEYQGGILGMLKEQRERHRIAAGNGLPEISDAQYEEEMRTLVENGVKNMPREQLEQLLREKDVTAMAEVSEVES